MRRLSITLAVLLALTGVTYAQGPGAFKFSAFTIQTNGELAVTVLPDTDIAVSAWLDAVVIDIDTALATNNSIVLSTAASRGTGPARTLLTLTDVIADGIYPVRDLAATDAGDDITGEPVRMPLVQDNLRVTATQGAGIVVSATGTIYVITSPVP